jgi:hypothetical protein
VGPARPRGRGLIKEAARKAKRSVSRRTGKPVKESSEELKINVAAAPGVKMCFTLTGPPQADRNRTYELARLHTVAFFYWVTYNHNSKTGGFWPGSFFPILETAKADWGNPLNRAFMNTVFDWEPRVRAIGADGFFKIAIRRHPTSVCWSSAVEWNHKFRVLGLFGEQTAVESVLCTLPALEGRTIAQGPDYDWRYREDIPLADEDDTLFF